MPYDDVRFRAKCTLAPTLPLYAGETHLAEKLHAYNVPRPRVNSRIKALPELVAA